MIPLSPPQQRILNYLREYIASRGYPPSLRDITQGCRISSVSVASHHLNILALLGYIRRDPGIQRGIVVLRKGELA